MEPTEQQVLEALALDDYDFVGWANGQRFLAIERAHDDVVGDFGEEGYASWAAEVELGLNDAAVFEDWRLLQRAQRLGVNRARFPWEPWP